MGDSYDYDLICIGSGPAGQRAAVQAAKIGRRVAVIEKRRRIGGSSLATGTIPSKTFREAVLSYLPQNRGLEAMGGGGGPPVRPRMDNLLERVQTVLDREARVMTDQLGRNDVQMVPGQASFADPHTVEVALPGSGGRRLTGERILVAVGTTPARPPDLPDDARAIITSDGVLELDELPRTLVVVGGGVIGIEYASMFAALGIEVTLVDRRRRPLEFLDTEIVDELMHQMRDRGVRFCMAEDVESLRQVERTPRPRVEVALKSGKRLVADVALFAIGRRGATDDLALERAGLETDERGRLEVDARFRTAVPHILAAGDVIGYPALAATSARQGRLAACYAFDVPTGPMGEHFPIGIYAIPEISMVGAPEHDLTGSGVPYEIGIARYREIARGQILGDDSGLFKMLFHRESRALLGVHIIGTGATELLHIGQAVMRLGGTLDYFLETVFNYPTLAECYKVAALDAANKLAS